MSKHFQAYLSCGPNFTVESVEHQLLRAIKSFIRASRDFLPRARRLIPAEISNELIIDEVLSESWLYLKSRTSPLHRKYGEGNLVKFIAKKALRRVFQSYKKGILVGKAHKGGRVKFNLDQYIDESYFERPQRLSFDTLPQEDKEYVLSHRLLPKDFAKLIGVGASRVYEWKRQGLLALSNDDRLVRTWLSIQALSESGLIPPVPMSQTDTNNSVPECNSGGIMPVYGAIFQTANWRPLY